MNNDKRLIEVAFPLKHTSIDSVHEKNVRHVVGDNYPGRLTTTILAG